MISSRIADSPSFDDLVTVGRTTYCFRRTRPTKPYRIYELHSGYSQTSGGTMTLGPVVRRYDPEARDAEGKPAEFATVAECEAYCRRWLAPVARRPR